MSSVAERLQRKTTKSPSAKQVRLKLVYIDFWSAVKLSFLISLCLGIALVVATFWAWRTLSSARRPREVKESGAREVQRGPAVDPIEVEMRKITEELRKQGR